jgi:hypothetical protein
LAKRAFGESRYVQRNELINPVCVTEAQLAFSVVPQDEEIVFGLCREEAPSTCHFENWRETFHLFWFRRSPRDGGAVCPHPENAVTVQSRTVMEASRNQEHLRETYHTLKVKVTFVSSCFPHAALLVEEKGVKVAPVDLNQPRTLPWYLSRLPLSLTMTKIPTDQRSCSQKPSIHPHP